MNDEPKPGAAETRAGLALVICFLVVLGYMVLHYLGGTRQAPPVEFRPGIAAEPAAVIQAAATADDQQPEVLTIESSSDAEQALRTSPGSDLH